MNEIEKLINFRTDILNRAANFYENNGTYGEYSIIAGMSYAYKNFVKEDLFSMRTIEQNNLLLSLQMREEERKIHRNICENTPKTVEKLKNNNVFADTCELYSKISNDLVVDRTPYRLSEREKTNIINGFLKTYNPEHKDLYNELVEEGRIISLDKTNMGLRTPGLSFPDVYGKNKDYVLISSVANGYTLGDDIYFINILLHELGHLIEFRNLNKYASLKDINNFHLYSPYTETNAILQEMKYADFLEEYGFSKEVANNVRKKNIDSFIVYPKNLQREITLREEQFLDYVSYSNKEDLKYYYGSLIALYLNSLNQDDFMKKIAIYNREKITDQDIEILEKMNCNTKNLVKSIYKH